MSKDILDVLSDPAKVEKIASLPTAKDVEDFFEKEENVKIDTKDIKVLENIFQEAVNKGAEAIDEKKLASVGGGFSLKKAAIAAGAIGTIFGGGYLADKYFNEGEGMEALKTGADKVKKQIRTRFLKKVDPDLKP